MMTFLASLPYFDAPAVPMETYTTVPQFLAPLAPAILVSVIAIAIECFALWTNRSTRFNGWFPIAMATTVVFVIIWDAWSSGSTMVVLADSPDADGLRFRLQLVAYGVLAVGVPLWMTVVGARQAIQERELSGYPTMLARVLPAPVVLAVIAKHFRSAIEVFANIDFKLFQ